MSASVIKLNGWDVYHVRADHEWATVALKGWQAPADAYCSTPREIGEILIHSSYGSWAYQWGHLGKPFKRWLAECNDPDYIACKFLGAKAYVFDGKKTVRETRRRLLEWRRRGELSKDEARDIWDWIDDNDVQMETSDRDYVESLLEAANHVVSTDGALRFLREPWEHVATTLHRGFANFWRLLMTALQQALRNEAPPPEAA